MSKNTKPKKASEQTSDGLDETEVELALYLYTLLKQALQGL